MKAVLNTNKAAVISLIVVGVLVLAASKTFFIVRVDQYAIVTQFGEYIDTKDEPGLYLRLPLVQEVQYLDNRIMEWDDSPQEMMTKDKKRIYINSFARWRIKDPRRYYEVVKTEAIAQLNLDKVLGRRVRDAVSKHNLRDVVRDYQHELEDYVDEESGAAHSSETGDGPGETGRRYDVSNQGEDGLKKAGRTELVNTISTNSKEELERSFGIDLIDIQLKQLNYTESAQRETIKEMISERMVVVQRYEALGEQKSERIRGESEKTLQMLQAEANEQKMMLEGQGLADAITIKSAAFGKDPDLYKFLETLRLYEESFDENTTMVLNSDNPLLKLLDGLP